MSPRSRTALYVVLVALVPLLAMRGVFGSSEIFYLRDLSFYFWPEHLWLRESLLGGEFPLWDPYMGFGQPCAADPIRQQFFLPTLILRLLTPTVGFNLIVALPFSVAALGMFLMLRRHASLPACALAAIVFGVSGPVLSTANFPNLSWSLALVPFVLWATALLAARVTSLRVLLLSSLFALLYTAGEAVVLLAAAGLAVAYSQTVCESAGRKRLQSLGSTLIAGVGGLCLAAPQALLSIEAIAKSSRVGGVDPTITSLWSFHPLGLVELVLPFLFGDYVREGASSLWFAPMNNGMVPFLFSSYVGVGVLVLAAAGMVGGSRREVMLWTSVALITLLLALGHHTPLYPFLQESSGTIAALRFPAKFLLFTVFAISCLAALGWDAIFGSNEAGAARTGMWTAGLLGICGVVLLVLGIAIGAEVSGWLAARLEVPTVEVASKFLTPRLVANSARLFLLGVGTGFLIWAAFRHPERRTVLCALLFGLVAADPLLSNCSLNPTLNADLLGEPAWAGTVRRGGGRVYVGGRLASPRHRSDADAIDLSRGADPTGPTASTAAVDAAFLATFPSAWAVRDSVSFDLSAVWPREYTALQKEMRQQGPEARVEFLRKVGVRYYLLSRAPMSGMPAVLEFPTLPGAKLFEDPRALDRARVVTEVDQEPDVAAQLVRSFREGDRPTVDSIPPASGVAATPALVASAVITEERWDRLVVATDVPAGGAYLFLADSFDSNWTVRVDQAGGQVARANGLFRVVALPEGSHVVAFEYESPALAQGLWVCGLTLGLFLVSLALEHGIKRRNLAV